MQRARRGGRAGAARDLAEILAEVYFVARGRAYRHALNDNRVHIAPSTMSVFVATPNSDNDGLVVSQAGSYRAGSKRASIDGYSDIENEYRNSRGRKV